MKKPTTWDDDETWGSDILGVGSYDRHAGNIGKVLNQTKIGFIRDDTKRKGIIYLTPAKEICYILDVG